MKNNQGGFTIIELVVVIAIIGLLVFVIYTALDPSTQLKESRDAVRQSATQNILSAIKLDQLDHNGELLASIKEMNPGEVYMIVNGSMKTGCAAYNDVCDTPVTDDTHCVDVSALIDTTHLPRIPVAPAGTIVWGEGGSGANVATGYTLQRDDSGVIQVRACEYEK